MEKLILDTDLVQNVEAEIERVLPEIIRFRHERHKNPELTWQEHATAQAVAKALSDKLGIVPMEGVGRLGVVGLIEGDLPGPTIALRADMDALPIQETSGKSYSSCRSGVMHACGHDGHMANLLGSAMVLQKLKHRLAGITCRASLLASWCYVSGNRRLHYPYSWYRLSCCDTSSRH
ncbi:MAG: M20/M25/M40 family metallo-hydrolase [Proteobacteria bacterium]|nr:M20/M25/M40 family metallo-hydrolase [Pseudomonadota bacterium]